MKENFTAWELFIKIMPQSFRKLLWGAGVILFSLLWLAILQAIAHSAGFNHGLCVGLLWLGGSLLIFFLCMRKWGYLIKISQMQAMANAMANQQRPSNPRLMEYEQLNKYFSNYANYRKFQKLLHAAIKQLHFYLEQAQAESKIKLPGYQATVRISELFQNIILSYVKNCCLAYCFQNNGGLANAARAVGIFFSRPQILLSNTNIGASLVVATVVFLTFLLYAPLGYGADYWDQSRAYAFFLAFFAALTLKFAFLDSWNTARLFIALQKNKDNPPIGDEQLAALGAASGHFQKLLTQTWSDNKPNL